MINLMSRSIIHNAMEVLLEQPLKWEIFKEDSTLPMIFKITIL